MPRLKSYGKPDRPPVTVEIDELVLHGFPISQRDAVATAFGDRLAELIGGHGMSPTAPALSASLTADALDLNAGARPDAIGRAVAQSVYQALRGGER